MPWDLSNVKESAGNSEWLLVDLLVWSGLLSCYITQLWSHGLQRWRSTVGFQEVCQISVFTGTLMQYWVVLNSACCTFNTIVLQRSQFMANVSAVSPRCFFFFKYEGMWTGLHIDVKHLLNLKRLFDFLFFFFAITLKTVDPNLKWNKSCSCCSCRFFQLWIPVFQRLWTSAWEGLPCGHWSWTSVSGKDKTQLPVSSGVHSLRIQRSWLFLVKYDMTGLLCKQPRKAF